MQLTPSRLRADASKCHDLASTAVTEEAREVLKDMADNYEKAAAALDLAAHKTRHSRPAFSWPHF